MSNDIKDTYIELTRKYQLKLPDALISASAIAWEIPFITEDKGFKKITELDLIFYHRTAPLAEPKKGSQ
jgi:predicted nucleic acid-binding protein